MSVTGWTRDHDRSRMKPAPGRRRRIGLRVGVAAMIIMPLLGVASPAHAAGLTERRCAEFITGDNLRKLSVCSRGWVDANGAVTRGVTEMHTYAFVTGGGYWVDSRSQSITMNYGRLVGISGGILYGKNYGSNCRVDGPAGPVDCSVANVVRVAFYSPAHNRRGADENYVHSVSWRDDRGIPHTVTEGESSRPDTLALISPSW